MNNRVISEYEHFRCARIRVDPGSYTNIREIVRCYKEWTEYAKCIRNIKTKKLTLTELCQHLIEDFGQPENEKRFRGLIVFSDSDSVDEWDKEHAHLH
jgi:hypothetical protein